MRFKGLGEMPAQLLYETTLDPLRRRLLRVMVPDDDRPYTERTVSELMGKEPEARFKFIMAEAKKHRAKLLPVDSEHSAVFQCLEGHPQAGVRRIVLTASGGAFRDWPADRLAQVTPADALKVNSK